MFSKLLEISNFEKLVGTKMVLNGPPIPIPGVSKSLLPGGKRIRKNTLLMKFYDFYERKKTLPGGLKRVLS
jgi:hypothetical protein